jgi:hypothetical protein
MKAILIGRMQNAKRLKNWSSVIKSEYVRKRGRGEGREEAGPNGSFIHSNYSTTVLIVLQKDCMHKHKTQAISHPKIRKNYE